MRVSEKRIVLKRMVALLMAQDNTEDENIQDIIDTRLYELYGLACDLGFTQDDLLDFGNNRLLYRCKCWSESGEAFQ